MSEGFVGVRWDALRHSARFRRRGFEVMEFRSMGRRDFEAILGHGSCREGGKSMVAVVFVWHFGTLTAAVRERAVQGLTCGQNRICPHNEIVRKCKSAFVGT